jgi:hypothetical protein
VAQTLLARGGVVAGNRAPSYYRQVPLLRRMLSKCFRWVLRRLLRQPIDDSQCGLKGFDNAGKAFFLKTAIKGFLFDLEFLMSVKGKVHVTPVPVTLREGVTFSAVSWKIVAAEFANLLRLLARR